MPPAPVPLQVPDAMGRSTLILDLGRLSFASAPPVPHQQQQTPAAGGAPARPGAGLMSLQVWPAEGASPRGGGLAGLAGGPALSVEEAAVYEVGVFLGEWGIGHVAGGGEVGIRG